jgi:hypothetical protein
MANERKVLVCVNHLADRKAPYLRRLEAAGFAVERNRLGRLYTEAELIAALDGVYATIAGGEPYTERVFASAPGLTRRPASMARQRRLPSTRVAPAPQRSRATTRSTTRRSRSGRSSASTILSNRTIERSSVKCDR